MKEDFQKQYIHSSEWTFIKQEFDNLQFNMKSEIGNIESTLEEFKNNLAKNHEKTVE